MRCVLMLLALVALPVAVCASAHESVAAANPIRKVVTLLQKMQAKVTAEGEKEAALYQKFECYCGNSGADLKKSIAGAGVKIPEVEAALAEAESKAAQLKADLEQHRADRDAAKSAMKDATAIREKEATAFAKAKGDLDANIAALTKAIAAISKGAAGGFLQTSAAQVLRDLLSSKQDFLGAYRQDVVAFLSGSESSQYAPQSGQIVGILKQLSDDMSAELAEATASEQAALKAYDALMAAKKKEVAALTASIEDKTVRSGNVAVAIVQMKDDLDDTEAALIEDKKFLADLEASCGTKKAEWDERVKTRNNELAAIAETISILNSDDALELFKKTLPSAQASFVQVASKTVALRTRAVAAIHTAQGRPELDFIVLALQGKTAGFAKVIEMIDTMVETLKAEQVDDDNKKEYCAAELDSADDKKKGLERTVAGHANEIAELEDGVANVAAEIKALEDGIAALDKSVQQATENRKAEHEDFTELMASDAAAKEVLNFAKNRLNQFYNPALYKPPPKEKLAEDDQIVANLEGASALQQRVAPPPPPETFGAYTTKTKETAGVVAMIDLLIKDLDTEMTEAQTTEEHAQKDYNEAMADASEKRAQDSASVTKKNAARASLATSLGEEKQGKAAASKELMATLETISALHGECDWLVQYFDARKEARAAEVDSLHRAKAVLSGANYSE